jgi:hypothetical protein
MIQDRYKVIGLVLGCSFMSALGLENTYRGLLMPSYLSFLSAWSFYFGAHYLETGSFMDGVGDNSRTYTRQRKMKLIGLSGFILVGTLVTAYGLRSQGLLVTWSGTSIVLLAYTGAHKSIAGDLL